MELFIDLKCLFAVSEKEVFSSTSLWKKDACLASGLQMAPRKHEKEWKKYWNGSLSVLGGLNKINKSSEWRICMCIYIFFLQNNRESILSFTCWS